MENKILIPYNFTPQDQKALDFAREVFGPLEGVTFTLFYTYSPVPNIATDDTMVTRRLRGNITYLQQQIGDRESELQATAVAFAESLPPTARVDHVFQARRKDIADEIIEWTNQHNYTIVLLNRRPARITRFFTGSIFSKVVGGLKDKAVCVVS